MNEIVEKLRAAADVAYSDDIGLHLRQEDCTKAAEEIERLRAALTEIEKQATAWRPPRYSWFGETASKALRPS